MNRLGNEFLARAALADYQHGPRYLGNAANLIEQFSDLRGTANYLQLGLDRLAKLSVVFAQQSVAVDDVEQPLQFSQQRGDSLA